MASKQGRPRQWIHDRVDGVSRVGEGRPPCFLCFPSPFLKCCPFLFEENCICTCLGRIGCFAADNDWARNAILKYGCVMNVAGLILTCYSALSLTAGSSTLLRIAPWGRAELTVTTGPDLDTITMDLGLRAVAVNNPNTFGEQVVPFDKFCDLVGNGIEKYMDPADCDKCNEVSFQLFIAVVVAAVAYIPTISTDILRMYGNYDVNCQKVWGALFSLCTLAGCILAYLQFTVTCLASFYEGDVYFSRNGDVLGDDEISKQAAGVVFSFDWAIGYGMICLYCAVGCKAINFLCNCCCVPTPNITRDKSEQEEYEKLDAESDSESSEED